MDSKDQQLIAANRRFQNAIQNKPQQIPPIWMMRQAGRYHSHYQNLRKKHSFEKLCKQPELAAEVALGPVMDFDFDLAILFSDILFPLDCLGLGLSYTDKGPRLAKYLDATTIDELRPVAEAVEGMKFQQQAMQLTRQQLPVDKSLIGFVGGPWTLFCYAIDGTHAGNLIKPKREVEIRQKFLTILDGFLKENIRYQLAGGAEVVMVLDTAAGDMSPSEFEQIIIPSLRSLVEEFPYQLGYYCKGASEWQITRLQAIPALTGVGFDHRLSLADQLQKKPSGFLQGNFDQCLLFQETKQFQTSLNAFLQPILELTPQQRSGWVCGLGHGILPNTPEAHVRQFVETVRRLFA